MSQQTDPAILVKLRSVDVSLIGQKLRLVGRLLSYDSTSGLILLLEGNKAILVDVSLCIDYWSGSWVRDHLSTIRVIGHLEASPVRIRIDKHRIAIVIDQFIMKEQLPIPTLPTYASAPALDPTLVIRAVLVERAPDIDMDLWNMAIEERERSK